MKGFLNNVSKKLKTFFFYFDLKKVLNSAIRENCQFHHGRKSSFAATVFLFCTVPVFSKFPVGENETSFLLDVLIPCYLYSSGMFGTFEGARAVGFAMYLYEQRERIIVDNFNCPNPDAFLSVLRNNKSFDKFDVETQNKTLNFIHSLIDVVRPPREGVFIDKLQPLFKGIEEEVSKKESILITNSDITNLDLMKVVTEHFFQCGASPLMKRYYGHNIDLSFLNVGSFIRDGQTFLEINYSLKGSIAIDVTHQTLTHCFWAF